MIRPMCGSSSATSTWRCSIASGPLDQGCHVLAIPSQLEQELPNVRLRLHENKKNCFGRQHRNHDEPLWVLEHAGDELAALTGGTKFVGCGNDGGDVRGQSFGVEIGHCLAIDQETVAAEHDRRLDAIAMPDGGDEFAYRRHALPWKSRAKHNWTQG